ncbi:uncharacterized protein LOC143145494 [Ptiloglossa arizonensis]|uniref:uncharacterized protein LOC143145494 n=1 Tax=Ptiloglossa arizonensis TaxID=3350558 RepID=UPI003F9FE82B
MGFCARIHASSSWMEVIDGNTATVAAECAWIRRDREARSIPPGQVAATGNYYLRLRSSQRRNERPRTIFETEFASVVAVPGRSLPSCSTFCSFSGSTRVA